MVLTYLLLVLTVAVATGKYLDPNRNRREHDNLGDIDICSIQEWGHYKPVPGHCDRFYQCAPSGPFITFAWQEMPCALDTFWNNDLKTCVQSNLADCESTQEPCCDQRIASIDLNGGIITPSTFPTGIVVLQGPVPGNTGNPCDHRVLIKANFERADIDKCVNQSTCGRRFLEINLKLSDGTKSGHLFDIGDSVSNNGYAGDGGHQSNDCEAHAVYPNVTIWRSDVCGSGRLQTIPDVLRGATDVDVYIGNQFIRINNNNGTDVEECSDRGCLYALNGQSDAEAGGATNEDVYIALNRVVSGSSRSGYGICSAQIKWKCDK